MDGLKAQAPEIRFYLDSGTKTGDLCLGIPA